MGRSDSDSSAVVHCVSFFLLSLQRTVKTGPRLARASGCDPAPDPAAGATLVSELTRPRPSSSQSDEPSSNSGASLKWASTKASCDLTSSLGGAADTRSSRRHRGKPRCQRSKDWLSGLGSAIQVNLRRTGRFRTFQTANEERKRPRRLGTCRAGDEWSSDVQSRSAARLGSRRRPWHSAASS